MRAYAGAGSILGKTGDWAITTIMRNVAESGD